MDPSQLTDEQRKELEEKLKNMSPEEIMELQKQQCIFCQIISGKIPSKKVYEDDKTVVILDINPAAKGHLLVIPKEHFAIMPQIPDSEIGEFFVVAKKMSQRLLKAMKVSGTNIYVANGLAAGQKAQHFMIHVVPRKEGDGVLDVEEKILDKEMLTKVKIAIENKLNEILGVKKEVITMEEKEEDMEETEEDIDEDVDDKKEENEDIEEEGTEEDPDVDDAGEDEEGDEEGEDEASLDDIANLFK